MQKISLLLVTSVFIFICCRREASIELGSRPVSGDSGTLFKKVDISSTPGVAGSATSTSEYEYNSEKKLIKQVFTSINGNKTVSSESRYIRDRKNRIISIESKSQELLNGVPYVTPEGPALDTGVSKVIYEDESSGKINYIKNVMRSGEKAGIDSTVYEYDNYDHVKKTTSYYLPWGIHQPGDRLMSSGYTAWTFNAEGSLLEIEQYAGSLNLQIRYLFEYDNKINPLFKNEDVFLGNWFDISPHNVVKQNVYIAVTNEKYDNTAVYKYRSDNKPLSVAYFSPPTVINENRESNFYYK